MSTVYLTSSTQKYAGYESKVIEKTQIIFIAVLAFWSLAPARVVPWVEFGEFRISFSDILLLVATPLAIIVTQWRKRNPEHGKYVRGFPLSFCLLIGYAFISLLWSQAAGIDAVAMLWTLLTTASTATLAYCVVYSNKPFIVQQRLWYLTTALAFISLIYFAESFFSLGLRSVENTAWTDFGIQRLRGPLYNSTVGQFILFPALGQSIDHLFKQRKRKWIAGLMVLLFCMCIFALGSRSVIFGIGAFVIIALTKLRTKAKLAFIAIAPIVLVVAGGFVFLRASSERMVSLTDLGRAMTYQTAITMIKTAHPAVQLFGAGYGGRWSWYITDVTPGALESELQFYETPSGYTLYHPHSTVLLVIAELGVVGFLLGGTVLLWLFRSANLSLRRGIFPFLNIGLVASLLICCLDLLIFKAPQVNTIWWIYACGAAAMTHSASRGSFPMADTRKVH